MRECTSDPSGWPISGCYGVRLVSLAYLGPGSFEKDLKVTIQDLGWRHDGRYNNQKSDISSTTFWYQVEPHAKFPALPSKDDLEIPRW